VDASFAKCASKTLNRNRELLIEFFDVDVLLLETEVSWVIAVIDLQCGDGVSAIENVLVEIVLEN
jgi:hypothetical protein